ncbi:MAG: sulfotransferase [Caldisphaeraceae archaeon]|nr:sulfotransferase [Caldisphaeraceae archaeon]MEB3797987.1 sulfotransferase [Caldisphaeraceae archaeon]
MNNAKNVSYRKTLGFSANKLSNELWQLLHRKRTTKDSLLVFGVGRSGTTLLMEILYAIPKYRIIFEPLHPAWGTDKDIAGDPELFPYHTLYRRLGEEDPRLKRYIEKVLTGSISLASPTGARTSYEVVNRILKNLSANKILVKCIRANKIIHWLAMNFKVRGIYLIIRHPCATIASQIKMGWYPKTQESIRFSKKAIKELLLKSVELEDRKDTIINAIERIEEPEEVMAAWWSLDYAIPLYYRSKNLYLLVYYEHLIENYEDELPRIFNYINMRTPINAYEIIKRPTSTSSSKKIKIKEQQSKWRNVLNPKKVEKISKIIEKFGL